MARNIVLDTNILLYDPQAVFHFCLEDVILPIEVIEEIEELKHDPSESGRNSRQSAVLIDALRQRGSLGRGVVLEHGGTLRVHCDTNRSERSIPAVCRGKDAAAGILRTAFFLREREPDKAVLIVTKNVNLRLKADALGIEASDYDVDRAPDIDQYLGWHEVETDAAHVAHLREGLSIRMPELNLNPNDYVFVKDLRDAKNARVGRVAANGLDIVPLLDSTRTICGIRGLNREQTYSIDALLDERISLVTLSGKAGTGKTLLAIAAGLHQVFADDRYHRVTVFRPTIAVSRDLGYLPGDLGEKMRPWMQPVYDAIELIRLQDRRQPARILPQDILTCEEVSVEPLTYIRGRSIPNQFIIIDEAQNLTPLEVKTAITRVGAGSKVVVTGDPQQIDNPYVDLHSNGLTALVDKFRESPLSAHITLTKGERSELAETAANLL